VKLLSARLQAAFAVRSARQKLIANILTRRQWEKIHDRALFYQK